VYEWDFDPPSRRRAFEELPEEAQRALLATLDALMFDPAGYERAPDEPEGKAVRRVTFGGGRGILTFVFHEPDRIVLVVQFSWI
jgi:hypothetical protein